MSPLSNRQKAEIGIAAHRAWLACPERAALLACNGEMSATAVETAWRHVEQGRAVGIQSLRACTQEHYGRLLGHFRALAGDAAGAARTLARDADNDRRIARWKLDQALRERGLAASYAGAICRAQFKCALAEASEKQLWKLLYTVRSRRKPVKPAAQADNCPF
jgi:hypothetical protein